MIIFDRVSRSFGHRVALSELSLQVNRGEVFGLLGPNGAGKTTAIRMMAGLLLPTGGRIVIAGHEVTADPIAVKSVMGYVPDRAFFYEKLTAREFMTFVASVYGLEAPVARKRINALSERFGLKEIEDQFIEGCSQGMRQRLLFASALVHQPQVLVVDEPIVGLDPFGVELVKGLIVELAREGTTVFLATHSLPVAAELCDRVGLIKQGGLISTKTRAEISAIKGGLTEFFMSQLGEDE